MRCINISPSIVASVVMLVSVHAHAAESGDDGKPRHAAEHSISVQDGAVAVDASNMATHVVIGSDDTVVLQSGEGSSTAPALVEAETNPVEPEKKATTENESSIWDDMVNAIGLGDETPAATPEVKK